MLLPVLLLLLLVCHTETNYTGAVYSYMTKDFQGGSFSVVYCLQLGYTSCQEVDSWQCCTQKIEEHRDEWCLKEYTRMWTTTTFGSTLYRWETGNWIDNRNGVSSGLVAVLFDVRNRSDTNRPNSSPQTGILPVVRVPSNCQRNISLLTFDPDGDKVECRYAAGYSECNICTPPSVLSLSSPCTLSFSPTNSSAEGSYAVQLMMEDFPRQNIILTNSAGSASSRSSSRAISKITVQFLFKVDPSAPSCTVGGYLPRFLPPTPEHGAQLFIDVNQMLEITIRAEATQSVITELLFNGPINIVKSSYGSGDFTLRWTPSASEDEESHPICFVVQANGSSSVYQSELRCVIVTVGNVTSTTVVATTIPLTSSSPPSKTSYLTVLKLKISTKLSMKDNHDAIVKAIRDELIRKGLPTDIRVRLLSNGSVEVKNQQPPPSG